MPHFVVDCSEDIVSAQPEEEIIEQIYLVAVASKLFDKNDIKVRINPYKTYLVGKKRTPFIHVFASVMQGRSTVQKAALSHAIVSRLSIMFPDVPAIAMNITDFEKATYCNREML